MEINKEYDFKTFGELFQEIAFDYEPYKNGPEIYIEKKDDKTILEYVVFYKTIIMSDGTVNRKGNTYTFDPKLFWKVKFMAKLLTNDPTLEILYG